MEPGEEQLKKAADLKLWMEGKISELEEEIEKLKEAQAMVDGVLRSSSFKPALQVSPRVREAVSEIPEMRELKRDKGGGGETIAIARVTRQSVIVEPVAEVTLRAETPPFKSFLLGKIFSAMKSTDEELEASGKLGEGGAFRYSVSERGGRIAAITVENYRDRERLAEILNTMSWTFSRMLEK